MQPACHLGTLAMDVSNISQDIMRRLILAARLRAEVEIAQQVEALSAPWFQLANEAPIRREAEAGHKKRATSAGRMSKSREDSSR